MPLLPKQEIINNSSTMDPMENIKVELHTEEEIPIDISDNVKQEAKEENVETSLDEFLPDELDFEPEEEEETIDPQISPYLEELLWQGFIETLDKKETESSDKTIEKDKLLDKNKILTDTERLARKKLFTDKTIFVYQLPLQVIKKLPKAWRDDGRLISARQLIRRLNTIKHKRPSAVRRTQKWLEKRRAKRGIRASSVSTTLSDSSGSRDYNRNERKRPSSPQRHRQRSPPRKDHRRDDKSLSGSPPVRSITRKRPHEEERREADRIKRTRQSSPREERMSSDQRSRDHYKKREYEQRSRDNVQRPYEHKRRSSESATYESRNRPSRVHDRLSSVHDHLSNAGSTNESSRRRRRSRSNSYERFCNREKKVARDVSYRSHEVPRNHDTSRQRLLSSSPDDLRSRIRERPIRRPEVIVVPTEEVTSSDYW